MKTLALTVLLLAALSQAQFLPEELLSVKTSNLAVSIQDNIITEVPKVQSKVVNEFKDGIGAQALIPKVQEDIEVTVEPIPSAIEDIAPRVDPMEPKVDPMEPSIEREHERPRHGKGHERPRHEKEKRQREERSKMPSEEEHRRHGEERPKHNRPEGKEQFSGEKREKHREQFSRGEEQERQLKGRTLSAESAAPYKQQYQPVVVQNNPAKIDQIKIGQVPQKAIQHEIAQSNNELVSFKGRHERNRHGKSMDERSMRRQGEDEEDEDFEDDEDDDHPHRRHGAMITQVCFWVILGLVSACIAKKCIKRRRQCQFMRQQMQMQVQATQQQMPIANHIPQPMQFAHQVERSETNINDEIRFHEQQLQRLAQLREAHLNAIPVGQPIQPSYGYPYPH